MLHSPLSFTDVPSMEPVEHWRLEKRAGGILGNQERKVGNDEIRRYSQPVTCALLLFSLLEGRAGASSSLMTRAVQGFLRVSRTSVVVGIYYYLTRTVRLSSRRLKK